VRAAVACVDGTLNQLLSSSGMRAIVLQAWGAEHLELAQRPDPEPGPGQVLVRMRYTSLNYRDLVVAQGGYGAQIACPLVPLSDGAGEVVATGAGASRFKPGDRVMTCFFQRWLAGPPSLEKLASSLGGPLDGCLCELRCLPEDGVCLVPDAIGLDEAAALPCAAVTAWNALAVLDRVGPTSSVLVQGTGGVSLFALQFAKLLGARVIATSSSDAKLERVSALGADHTINYSKNPQWGKLARSLSGGDGVDHVIEVGGAGTLQQSLRAVRPGGTISLIGVLAGARHQIDLPRVFLPQVRLQGVVVGSRATTEQMLYALERHALRPIIDPARFGMTTVRAAFDHLRAGKHFGKVSLAIDA
jgi:NADPH:quinone reductase-like Zn-dependent oxidoreductase